MTQFDFSGRVAIVTGGGSGIGEACADLFARSGASVVVADYDEEGGRRVTDRLVEEGGTARFVSVDVSDAEQVRSMVRETVDAFGGLHLAVNNAGIGGAAELVGDYPLDSWRQVIDVNLNGVFYCMRHQIPAMLETGGGAIVNMASILGRVGFATASAYVAAKHGVVGLSKAAALEYATEKIRVNSVGPGFIDTPLLANNLEPAALEGIAGMHPVQRLGTSAEVAALVAFLCSDDASFLTGGYYLVDGGYTAQ